MQLLDPLNIQQTSVTIQWKILQTNQQIDRYLISIISEKDLHERTETIINKHNRTMYTVDNLQPNTEYSIRLSTNAFNRPSNTIVVRTLESVPSSSPIDVQVELTSVSSLSIRWNPPVESDQNGRIIAYKVNCLGGNESSSIRLANISSDAKGLHIKNLIENMQYCISVAARTSLGYGPYSQPICVTMSKQSLFDKRLMYIVFPVDLDEDFLKLNRNLYQSNFKRRFREAITQPWSVFYLFSLISDCIRLFYSLGFYRSLSYVASCLLVL